MLLCKKQSVATELNFPWIVVILKLNSSTSEVKFLPVKNGLCSAKHGLLKTKSKTVHKVLWNGGKGWGLYLDNLYHILPQDCSRPEVHFPSYHFSFICLGVMVKKKSWFYLRFIYNLLYLEIQAVRKKKHSYLDEHINSNKGTRN